MLFAFLYHRLLQTGKKYAKKTYAKYVTPIQDTGLKCFSNLVQKRHSTEPKTLPSLVTVSLPRMRPFLPLVKEEHYMFSIRLWKVTSYIDSWN
jgi:hypothetical protein